VAFVRLMGRVIYLTNSQRFLRRLTFIFYYHLIHFFLSRHWIDKKRKKKKNQRFRIIGSLTLGYYGNFRVSNLIVLYITRHCLYLTFREVLFSFEISKESITKASVESGHNWPHNDIAMALDDKIPILSLLLSTTTRSLSNQSPARQAAIHSQATSTQHKNYGHHLTYTCVQLSHRLCLVTFLDLLASITCIPNIPKTTRFKTLIALIKWVVFV
jgi:hypothetical protein